jgi:hypothetical protein
MTFKTRHLATGAAIILLVCSTVSAQSTAPAAGSTAPAAGGAAPTAGGTAPYTAAPMAMPATPAQKSMTSKDMAALFTKADVNKDGKLDRVEAENFPGLSARFEQVDTDADKMVSKAELEKAMK